MSLKYECRQEHPSLFEEGEALNAPNANSGKGLKNDALPGA